MSPSRSIRPRLVLAVLLALGLLAAACSSDADSTAAGTAGDGDGVTGDASASDDPEAIPPGTVIRVGDQGGALEIPLRLAGELDDLPYEVEFATFASGPLVNEAFSAGAIDIGMMGDTPALLSFASGLDTVVVGVRASDGVAQTLVARPGSGIESLEDLEGRSVAFTTGTNQHGFVLRALESVGLDQSDIEQVDVPLSDVVNVLAGGQADAAVVYEVYRAPYLADNPDAAQLANLQDFVSSYIFLLALRPSAEDPAKAAAIEDFVARLARSGEWVEDNEEAWIEAYYVDQQRQTPEFGRIAHEAQGTTTWVPIDDVPRDAQQSQADLFHTAGFLPEPVDLSPQFDPSVTGRFSDAIQEALR